MKPVDSPERTKNRTRSGRRGGESTTRTDILTAARHLFGENGFTKTSMRSIATEAGVDVALVSYHFGSKRGLFTAVMEVPGDPISRVTAAASGPRSDLGRRLITTFTSIWENDDMGVALQAMLRSAVNDDGAAKAFGDFASGEMMPALAKTAGLSQETVRAIGSCVFGLALMRYLIRAESFTSLTVDELVDQFGPKIQAIVDQGR
ncbi:TetR family transcriptional regulator [Gordonia phthalatica]|uniref:TetR family transcriptional regulator n=1 Tax=Gordonia phthalatica TaxID=1136941 RepID=A0A0N9NFG6_9ACTN|nr:TetR family transcriptional regulator [Gordonia phthalatica]ALG84381.1 TetR family transcriptional regulator [Gordonia phthalatica]